MRKIDMTDVQDLKEYKQPEAGAYICIITDVEDHPKEQYLEVEYDIANGEFFGYYAEARDRGLDWIGKYRKYYTEKSKPFFKRFCSAVSQSNGNFVFDANEVNCDETTLIGKNIGLVFQEVEYYKNTGTIGKKLEVYREFPVGKIDSQKVPAPKLLNRVETSEFKPIEVAVGIDEELPFA